MPPVSILLDSPAIYSPKRLLLCSRENAVRVADRLCGATRRRVWVLRTGHPLQPYRVAAAPPLDDTVDLEMRL